MTAKTFNIGTIITSLTLDNYPKGLVLKGECSSENVDYFRIIWDDRKIDIIDLIPILAYLKKRKIID